MPSIVVTVCLFSIFHPLNVSCEECKNDVQCNVLLAVSLVLNTSLG